jgi:hypothetical protein
MLMVVLFFVALYQWMREERSLRGAPDEEEAERNGERRRGYSGTNLYE